MFRPNIYGLRQCRRRSATQASLKNPREPFTLAVIDV